MCFLSLCPSVSVSASLPLSLCLSAFLSASLPLLQVLGFKAFSTTPYSALFLVSQWWAHIQSPTHGKASALPLATPLAMKLGFKTCLVPQVMLKTLPRFLEEKGHSGVSSALKAFQPRSSQAGHSWRWGRGKPGMGGDRPLHRPGMG